MRLTRTRRASPYHPVELPASQGYVKRYQRLDRGADAAACHGVCGWRHYCCRRRPASRLRAQLEALARTPASAVALNALLPLISQQYEKIDEERRGVVRSMQLLAEEARSFAQGLANADAGQLRAILDHIKDVVITTTGDGAICVFNPTGEQLFGYSQAELIGVSIARLLPDLAIQGSLQRGLQAFANVSGYEGRSPEPRPTQARRKGGALFPVEVIASLVRIDRRDVFVLCLRDTSERRIS